MKRILEMIVLLPVAGFAFPVLIDSAFKGTILLAVILLAVLTLRSASAALRHLILVTAMIGLLLLPLLSITLPGWRILPSWAEAPQNKPLAAPQLQVGSDYHLNSLPTTHTQPLSHSTPSKISPPWIKLTVCAWFIGAAALGLRLTLSQLSLWRLGRSAIKCRQTDHLAMLEKLRSDLEISREVELVVHPARAMPMTWGILKTRLLLPAESRAWDESRLVSVLLHELAHVKRRDCLTQLLVQSVCTIHWFNPLVWLAASRIASKLEGRLTSILNQHTNRRTISPRAALSVVFSLALLALPVAMMRPAVADDSGQKSIEEMASDWAAEKTHKSSPEIDAWFQEKESLLDPTKKRWRLKVGDPLRPGKMAPIGLVADHYLEKYADQAALRGFAERRSAQHAEIRELKKKHQPEHRALLASEFALSEIERQVVRLGRALDKGASAGELNWKFETFTTRAQEKQLEKQKLLDMGLAKNHPKVAAIQTEIELLNELPMGLSEQLINRELLNYSVRKLDEHKFSPPKRRAPSVFKRTDLIGPGQFLLDDTLPSLYYIPGMAAKPKSNSAETFFLEGGQETPSFQRNFLGGAANLRSFDFRETSPPATIKDPRSADKWEDVNNPALEKEQPGLKADPADAYLQSYLLVQEAESSLEAGKTEQARKKFEQAAKHFQAIRWRFPSFEPEMVQFRTQKINEALDSLPAPDNKLREKNSPLTNLEAKGIEPSHPQVGIGVTLEKALNQRHIRIGMLLPGAPAERNGKLKSGDHVIAVSPKANSELVEVEGMSIPDFIELIRGKVGEPVSLLIERKEGARFNQELVTIIRDQLVIGTPPLKGFIPIPENQPPLQKPTLLPLKSTDAATAKTAIDTMLAGSNRGRVIIDEQSNSLVYIGDEPTLKLVRSLIEWLEESNSP